MSDVLSGAQPPVANNPLARLNKKDRRHYSAGDHDHNGQNSKAVKLASLPQSLQNLLNPIAARITRNAAATILDQTEAVVGFTTADFNTGGSLVDLLGNRLVIQTPGLYTFKYHVKWTNGASSTSRKAFLYVGGSIVDYSVNPEPVGTTNNFQGASVCKGAIDLVCPANQIIQVKAWHNNGSPLDITHLGGGTWLSAICLRRDA